MKLPIVEVSFLDHSMSDGTDKRLIPSKAVGYLLGQDSLAYYVAFWVCDGDPDSHNSETISILKHPTTKVRKIGVGSK